ncbi:MAG: ATP-binding protein [Phenylobacterium sp.]
MRILSARTAQDCIAGTAIAIAASPFVAIEGVLWFLALVFASAALESLIRAAQPKSSWIPDTLLMARSLVGSAFGLVLIQHPDPDAAIIGLAIWGALVFTGIVVDYRKPRRLWFRVGPPLLIGVFRHISEAVGHFGAGLWWRAMADLALMALLLTVFSAAYLALREGRLIFERVLGEVEAKNRLLQDAQRIAEIAEHLGGSGHFRIDRKMNHPRISKGLLDLYQFDANAAEDGFRGIFRLHDEGDQARIFQTYQDVVRTGLPARLETRSKLRDGRVKHILTQCNPEFDEDGNVVGVIGVSLDVTEARRREAALSESEARLRLLADNISDIVIWVSPAKRVLYASPSSEALGVTPDSLLRRPLEDFIHPEDRPRAHQLLDRVFEDQPIEGHLIGEFRFLIRGRIDEPVWLEGYAKAIRDPQGQPRSAVINFRDVTQRRALEEDLRLAKTNAEAAAQAKSEFLANMSHEVRTPLTGVIGFSTLLARTPDLPEAANDYVQKVVASGEALMSVVNDILDFSKLEAGQVDLDPTPFHLSDFLEEIADLFRLQAQTKGLDVTIQIEPSTPHYVFADRARVKQVLFNLLSNALKFTERGSIGLDARYVHNRSLLEISVTDTGVGVEPALIEKLFQRFTQADGSISRRYGGSGLGLSICRQLTELMGGGIWAKSTPGVGSVFTFNLLAPETEGAALTQVENEVVGDEQALRILVVDDLDANREIVRALLEAVGQEVHEASGGQEAVSLAMREPFDLILMDLQMPGMDGFATTRAIRDLSQENRTTPIVALSANVLPEHVVESRRAGMNDHIGKPIVPTQLIAILSRWAGVRVSPDSNPVEV